MNRTKRGIFTILVAFWMGLIFWFSAQPAVESSKMSHSVGKAIGNVLIPDFESLSKQEQEKIAEKIDYPIRKAAHAMEYAVLGGLLVLMYGSYGIIGKKGMAYGILTGVAYAMTDEIHQLFVPGRSCQVTDVLIDSTGVIFGSIIGILIYICTVRKRSR
ncbi:VanZ family protein [Faecalimonas sp.]